jgi:hypothetical protein
MPEIRERTSLQIWLYPSEMSSRLKELEVITLMPIPEQTAWESAIEKASHETERDTEFLLLSHR